MKNTILKDPFSKIRNSKYFIVIGTENFFKNITNLSQANYAKSLNKPFRIVLEKGVRIPESFLEGLNNYKVIEVHDFYNIEEIVQRLCTE